MVISKLVAAVALMYLAFAAKADHVPTDFISYSWSEGEPFAFPEFDENLGVLTGVSFWASGLETLTITITNPTDSIGYFGFIGGPSRATLSYSGIKCANVSEFWFAADLYFPSVSVEPHSEFTGSTEGGMAYGFIGSDPDCLSSFIGNDRWAFSLSSGFDLGYPDFSPGLIPSIQTSHSIQSVGVSYTYQPIVVPEPGYVGLSAGLVLALALIHRARHSGA